MTVKRRSVSLNKATRSEILHSFFQDITKQGREDIKVIEQTVAKAIYDVIFGEYRHELDATPDAMLCNFDDIPFQGVVVKAKKRARKRGSIEPTQNEIFQFRRFSSYMSLDCKHPLQGVGELSLSKALPQYESGVISRWSDGIMRRLIDKGFVSTADEKKMNALYVKACREQQAITAPIVEIMEGVIEIMENVKTTKGLLDVWPECEKYLALPEQSNGALMKVDLVKLNTALDGFYPPAEKSSGA